MVGVTALCPFRGIVSRDVSPVISSYKVPWASKKRILLDVVLVGIVFMPRGGDIPKA